MPTNLFSLDFEARNETELSISKGDIIVIISSGV